jgi:hypothetical protein
MPKHIVKVIVNGNPRETARTLWKEALSENHDAASDALAVIHCLMADSPKITARMIREFLEKESGLEINLRLVGRPEKPSTITKPTGITGGLNQ